MEFGSTLLEIGPPSSLNFPVKWKMTEMDCVSKRKHWLRSLKERDNILVKRISYFCFKKSVLNYTLYTSKEFEN